ncbi:MAG: hypothetical protein OXJ37_12050 [Bryobacterales bacterium]|nr:hypothetical protein [Bryobacterales bacterium]
MHQHPHRHRLESESALMAYQGDRYSYPPQGLWPVVRPQVGSFSYAESVGKSEHGVALAALGGAIESATSLVGWLVATRLTASTGIGSSSMLALGLA